MQKKYLLSLAIIAIFVGCTKRHLATVEATDYAMDCQALINEINLVRSQYQTESDGNTAKNVVGKVMTFGIYSADEENEIMLRERARSLQLIYTIKQAKGECEALTKSDVKVDSTMTRTIKNTKETFKSSEKALTE